MTRSKNVRPTHRGGRYPDERSRRDRDYLPSVAPRGRGKFSKLRAGWFPSPHIHRGRGRRPSGFRRNFGNRFTYGQGQRTRQETRHTFYFPDKLGRLQGETPSEIVLALQDDDTVKNYMDFCFDHNDILHILISVLEKGFTNKNIPGLLLNMLNILRKHDFIRKSLECLKVEFQDNVQNRFTVIDSVKLLVNILNWTTQKNPSSLSFLHGSLAFLENFIEFLNPYIDDEEENEENDSNTATQQTTTLNIDCHEDNSSNTVDDRPDEACEKKDDESRNTRDINTCSAPPKHSDEESQLTDDDQITISGENKEDKDDRSETTSPNGIDSSECENSIYIVKETADITDSPQDIVADSIPPGLEKVAELPESIGDISQHSNAFSHPSLSSKINDLYEHVQNFILNLKKYHVKDDTANQDSDVLDEFRTIQIFPCIEDINGTIKTKLRASKVKGSYKNLSDYLDVHFRLLREDFIAPLRKAVRAFAVGTVCKNSKGMRDIKSYENVRILSPIFREGVKHTLEFDVTKLGNVRWNTSNRLKYGALVCLSADNFQSCYFATISDADVRKKRDGIIQVKFENNDIACINAVMKCRFTMIESPAFFEAYRHVLSSLQNLTDDNFTLAKYIVYSNTKIDPPKYLHDYTTYNFGFLRLHKELKYTIPNIMQLRDHTQAHDVQLNIHTSNESTFVLSVDNSQIDKEGSVEMTSALSSIDKVWENRNCKSLNKTQLNPDTDHLDDDSKLTIGVVAKEKDVEQKLSDCTMTWSNMESDAAAVNRSVEQGDMLQYELKLPYHVTDTENGCSTKTIDIVQNQQASANVYDLSKNDIDRNISRNDPQPLENKQDTHQKMEINETGDISEDEFDSTGRVEVLHGKWPDADQLGLDISQYNAFKAALTSELTLIQGPPGCGKTYVGLQIVKTLLENKHARQGKSIMILCYTNHALDQFMTEICNSNQGRFVRVGSRISTENMKKISLSNYRQEYRKNKRFPLSIYVTCRNVRQYIRDYELEFNLLSRQIYCLKRNIVSINSLQCVAGEFFKQFKWRMKAQQRVSPWLKYLGYDVIVEWLGIYDLAQEISNSTFHRTEQFRHLDNLTDESISCDQREMMSEKRCDLDGERQENLMTKFRKENLAVDLDDIVSDMNMVSCNKRKIVRLERERLKKTIRLKLNSALEKVNQTTDESSTTDIFSENFTKENRWILYQSWVDKKCNLLMEKMSEMYDSLIARYECKRNIAMLEDAYILKSADVIGMTTTGAARINNTLREVKPDILIVEEAAEVFEAHVVSNLTAECKHLILIGDHKQLKPKPEEYRLEVDYNLDLSLFERLINNGIECHALQVQHRMRPEIADNIRHIYRDLKDHQNVKEYEFIKGIKHNAFFLNHSNMESKPDELSYVNDHEALFLVRLCQYLLLQGYDGSKITILTTYKGQMFKIRKEMLKKNLQDVLVTVVDNYQGEENDIILISFVRSNDKNRVGFVAKDNRVCVALSRAKKGLYAIGNFEQLSNSSPLWNSVVSCMKEKGLYGDKLPLICQNHDNDEGINVHSHDDFDKAPEGGCTKACDVRLHCGHVCTRKCHILDRDHSEVKCGKPCTRSCKNNHPCEKKCYVECSCDVEIIRTLSCGHVLFLKCKDEDNISKFVCKNKCGKELLCGHICQQKCGDECKCLVLVHKKIPKCGHDVEVPCCVDTNLKCSRKCDKILPCGHRCRRLCRDNCSPCMHTEQILRPDCGHLSSITCEDLNKNTQCMKPCGRTLTCGHTCKAICSVKNGETSRCPNGHSPICREICNYTLKCGHNCTEKCFECNMSGYHTRCMIQSEYNLICGHTVTSYCGDTKPCENICKRSCRHRRCEHKCSSLCKPCKEPCSWRCEHYSCSKLCGEICDRPICNLPCEKLLNCGHRCHGICGDPCPLLCFVCRNLPESEAVIQLQDCGCIFPVEQMDRHMESDVRFFKTCPRCNERIHTTNGNRYEKNVNAGWKNMNDLKNNCEKQETIVQKSYQIFRNWACTNDTKYSLTSITSSDMINKINKINKYSIAWFINEITDISVYRTMTESTFVMPGVDDSDIFVRWCLFKECWIQEKEISCLDINITLLKQAFESLFPGIGLTKYPRNIDIQLSNDLPYLVIEEDNFEDSDSDKTIHHLHFKQLESEQNNLGSVANTNEVTIHNEVTKVIDSLVNLVCQNEGKKIEDALIMYSNRSDNCNNENVVEYKDVQTCTKVAGVQTASMVSFSHKRIEITEYMRDDRKYTVPSGESKNYTLYLMKNPWNEFVADDPAPVISTDCFQEISTPLTFDEIRQTVPIGHNHVLHSQRIDSNLDVRYSDNGTRSFEQYETYRDNEKHSSREDIRRQENRGNSSRGNNSHQNYRKLSTREDASYDYRRNSSRGGTRHDYDRGNSSTGGTSHDYNRENSSRGGTSHDYNRQNSSRGGTSHDYNRVNSSRGGTSNDYNRGNSSRGSTSHEYSRGNSSRGSTSHDYNRGNSSREDTSHDYNRGNSTRGGTRHDYDRGNSSTGGTSHDYYRENSSRGGTSHDYNRGKSSRGGTSHDYNRGNSTREDTSHDYNRGNSSKGGTRHDYNRGNSSRGGTSHDYNRRNSTREDTKHDYNRGNSSRGGTNRYESHQDNRRNSNREGSQDERFSRRDETHDDDVRIVSKPGKRRHDAGKISQVDGKKFKKDDERVDKKEMFTEHTKNKSSDNVRNYKSGKRNEDKTHSNGKGRKRKHSGDHVEIGEKTFDLREVLKNKDEKNDLREILKCKGEKDDLREVLKKKRRT